MRKILKKVYNSGIAAENIPPPLTVPERIKELRRGPHGGPRGCSGAESIKPILPTFTGKGKNIFDISTLTQEFWTVFLLPSNPYPTGQTTKQHTGQCLARDTKEWCWTIISRRSLLTDLALSSCQTPGEHRPIPYTSETANFPTTLMTIVVSTSMRSASKKARLIIIEHCPVPTCNMCNT